ncbi:M15 family metallopeptidase [Polaribacter sp. IC073]|uniref:M15 family metallopeptidase n=1 Tax=Polaribacter sp. IC073 TaxID=2508540 RepID=UPI0011BFDD5E|nr:M15 family metallopeptidase [Polaribacter sp. IC073]TXD48680.1 M15 family metallopeptidase [Polaribacter sp. IC073]
MKRILIILTIFIIIFYSIISYCYHNFQFWTHLKTEQFETLREYNGKNIIAFRGRQILVHKSVIPRLIEIDNYAKNNNLILTINQSFRFNGQNISRAIVKPAKFSNHLAGFAIDFNIEDENRKYFSNDLKRNNRNKLPINVKKFLNKIRKNKKLRWGGDFNKEDPIHIDTPINFSKKKWLIYNQLCDNEFSKGIPKWKVWEK